jgi:hypothetical protein
VKQKIEDKGKYGETNIEYEEVKKDKEEERNNSIRGRRKRR